MFGSPNYERTSSSRPRIEAPPRSFQRYEMSPIRNNSSSLRLFADDPKSRRDRDEGNDWRGRVQISPPRKRMSNSPQRRRSRSPERNARRGSPKGRRMISRSPIRTRYSRSPPNSWRQHSRLSPLRRSPRPVGISEHNSYSNRRDRSRSGSNMEIASNGSSPTGFRNTFRPVEQKKTKKIKISVPKDLPREDSSPDVVEIDYHGYKIRNAPEVHDSKRRSRWDTDQSALRIPNTKEIFEKQGVRNPEAALERIANLPTMESQFKSKTDDDDAVQTQLRLLEQQQHFAKIRENLPPSTGMPSSIAFSAIGKPVNKNLPSVQPVTSVPTLPSINLTTTVPTVNGAAVANFVQPSFAAQFSVPTGAMPIPPFQIPNFAAPPPTAAGLTMPPTSMPMAYPMPNFNAPPPMMPDVVKFNLTNIGFPSAQEPQMDPTEALFRARADLYRRDLSIIRSIPDLMKYMWTQGYDPISPDDPPLLFNEVLKNREGTLGASALYQIICFGHPELETYYCGMCNHWTTVSEMFNHLNASMHRMNFLARKYKLFHKKAEEHQDLTERDKFLDFICKRVWKVDRGEECVNRMRCILNIDAIQQVWPNYLDFVDNSWKVMSSKDGMDSILSSKQPSMLDERPIPHIDHNETLFPVRSDREKITIKPSLNSVLTRPIGELERVDDRERYRRSRSKSRDRTRKRSRSRRRSSSREKRDSRRRSRSKSPRHSRISSKDDWKRKAAQFIDQINSDGIRSAFDSLPTSSKDDFENRNRRREATESENDQITQTRRALAVLIELQQFNSNNTPIKKSMVYTIASEMGMDEEAVRNSKILKQGLESMTIIDDTIEQKSVSLESLGMSSSDLKKLLSSVANKDDFDLGYPEVESESKLAISIRAAIRETKQKMNDPNNGRMLPELQSRLDHLEVKLSEALGVEPVRRAPSHAMQIRPRPIAQNPLPPGAWRNPSALSEQQRAATLRARQEHEEKTSRADDNKFDASKVEKEWTEYYLKDPSKIDELDKPDKHAEAQYDGYYGPGTYVAFCAAKKRAAINARKALGSRF